jgi:hypothetical protein
VRKIALALAAGAAVFSSAALAQAAAPTFGSKGDCQRWIKWSAWFTDQGLASPIGALPANPTCIKVDGKWLMVTG